MMVAVLLHGRRRRIWIAGALLLIGLAVLAASPWRRGSEPLSWEILLAPYSQGAPLPDGFRIDQVRRGSANDVVISIRRPADAAEVEVHILPRGHWIGIRESQSFGIAYETPHSTAAERDAITDVLAQTIRSRDHGLPWPAAIPLGPAFEGRFLPWLADGGDWSVRAIQVAWALLILSTPILAWRGGRAIGLGGGRIVLVMSACAIVALAALWQRGDEPLHANGHAWREAREVLAPWGARAAGTAPFMHGRGGIALQWLLAGAERTLTGTANPFRISRLSGVAAAAATAFLVAVLVDSPLAGLAAGCVLALTPLAQTLAVSGSALAIVAWVMPWSLGLLIAAGRSGDRFLLAGAALAGALGTLSHTAMLAWPPALCVAWLVASGSGCRRSAFALGALLTLAGAWVVQALNTYDMISSRNQGSTVGLLGEVRLGLLDRNLMTDPQWVSPLLLPMALVWVATGLRRDRFGSVAGSVLQSRCVPSDFRTVPVVPPEDERALRQACPERRRRAQGEREIESIRVGADDFSPHPLRQCLAQPRPGESANPIRRRPPANG